MLDRILPVLRCPRCRSPFASCEPPRLDADRSFRCSNSTCKYSKTGFSSIRGAPILIDFDSSIFEERQFIEGCGKSVIARDGFGVYLRAKVRGLGSGENKMARKFCARLVSDLRANCDRPCILVIGGGTVGSGARALYGASDIDVIGTDVYQSDNVVLVADAHQLPFADCSFDGVWIQAVLEHVLDPSLVVSEIHRVLKAGGVVYADTPFMQQVHEGAYDFSRFSVSGHRWLFRRFHHEASGAVAGPGTALVWSIRYFVRALTGSNAAGALAAVAVFWLRVFDGMARRRQACDAASGVFFYGRKADTELSPKEIVSFYERQLSE